MALGRPDRVLCLSLLLPLRALIMPRIFQNGFDIPLGWSETALAVWHKYPNPYATHVISMDVISQTFDERSGLLRVERILGVKQGAPKWAVKVWKQLHEV